MHFVPDILWAGGKKKTTIRNFTVLLEDEHTYAGNALHLTNCGMMLVVYGDGHWVRMDLRECEEVARLAARA